jgi:Ca2+/H+ antiporter, TMEM165/GDT1 family
MDALIPAFVLALLLEQGDRTQLLAIALTEKYGRPAAVLLGIACAAAINLGLAAAGGLVAADIAPHSGLLLLTALALVLAGGGAPFKTKPAPDLAGWRLGAFASSLGSFFILAFGDKTQFAVFGLAAASGQPVLAGLGATAGVVVGNLPAILLGSEWPRLVPLRLIRIAIGVAVTLAGLVLAVSALRIG